MTTAELTDLMAGLKRLWVSLQAGEAEIARDFLAAPHEPQDHVRWLRHQCLRELRGPGLIERPKSRTRYLVDNIANGLPAAETAEGRAEFLRQLLHVAEEFDHYKRYADILEGITGEPVRMEDIRSLTLPSDERNEELRSKLIAEDERLGRLAYEFTEGGGAGIFHAQAALESDDPLMLKIKAAGRSIFDDEVGHGEYGIEEVAEGLENAEEFVRFRDMIVQITRVRLRMRAEMHGTTISDERIQEIIEGKIEPIKPLA